MKRLILELLSCILLMCCVVLSFYYSTMESDYSKATYWIALAILYTQWCYGPKDKP